MSLQIGALNVVVLLITMSHQSHTYSGQHPILQIRCAFEVAELLAMMFIVMVVLVIVMTNNGVSSVLSLCPCIADLCQAHFARLLERIDYTSLPSLP